MSEDVKEYEGFIDCGDVNTEDVHEPISQPTGVYDLEVKSAKAKYAEREDGSGKYLKNISVIIEFIGVDNAAAIFHNISLWDVNEEKRKRDFKIIFAKKFYKLFNLPWTPRGINTTDLIGAKAIQAQVDLVDGYDKGDGVEPPKKNQLNLNNIHV
jgi:hypothetical protein